MPTLNLRSSTVLITGAASGIGYALALEFAREGANIIATDISIVGLDKLRPEIEALGVTCRTAILDVSDGAAFDSLATELDAQDLFPQILVNNAGIGVAKTVLDTDKGDWESLFNVNLYGMLNGSTAFVRRWLARKADAHLVNIASAVGVAPLPGMVAYAASKAAAYAFSEGLAAELAGTGIDVTTICPGAINTNITSREGATNMSAEQRDAVLKYYREQGTSPADVAMAVVASVKKHRPVVYVGNGARGIDIARRFLPVRSFRNLLSRSSRQLGLTT